MFGFGKRTVGAFSGSVYNNDGHLADIELDGSGVYQGKRKLWRFRLVKGTMLDDSEYEMRMQNRSRSVRFSPTDDNNFGYVELL